MLPATDSNDALSPRHFRFDGTLADSLDPNAVVAAMRVGPCGSDRDHGAGFRGAVRLEAGSTQFDPAPFQ
jgi:hypothetical protein